MKMERLSLSYKFLFSAEKQSPDFPQGRFSRTSAKRTSASISNIMELLVDIKVTAQFMGFPWALSQ